jgi:hypothetical protein
MGISPPSRSEKVLLAFSVGAAALQAAAVPEGTSIGTIAVSSHP